MYIEFDLKKNFDPLVQVEIRQWAEQFNIQYNIKINKQILKLTFVNNELYSFFCLTWNPKHSWTYKLIEPLKN